MEILEIMLDLNGYLINPDNETEITEILKNFYEQDMICPEIEQENQRLLKRVQELGESKIYEKLSLTIT